MRTEGFFLLCFCFCLDRCIFSLNMCCFAFDGNTGDAVIRTTMISPVAWAVRTRTWRRKPYPVSSSNTFILKEGRSSRIVPMISSAFLFSIRHVSTGRTVWVPSLYTPEMIRPFLSRAMTAWTLFR
jgi:hypothetical protein